MKAIRQRNYWCAVLTIFSIMTVASFFVFGETKFDPRAQVLSIIFAATGVVFAGFWINESKKLEIARLITDNLILYICTATINDISNETVQPKNTAKTEIFISYFGILLDSKIIKFNQDGIRLKKVEIGPGFISFVYGTEKRIQKIWLLRPPTDPSALDELSEKFHHETGIRPKFVS